MIYCNLKEIKNNYAVYYFGIDLNNITGEVVFYSTLTEPRILKYPETGTVPRSWLSKIVVKYKNDLTKCNFPEKMSYER